MSSRLSFTACLLVACLALSATPTEAKGRKDPALRAQIRQLMTDFRAQRAPLQDQVKVCGQDYLAALKLALNLDDAGIDALEVQLDAAYEVAEDRFELLPDADQLHATLRTYILEELKKVTDGATADAWATTWKRRTSWPLSS